MPAPRCIQIAIDDPCHQNWDDMAAAGQGRFCNACQKTVIDFTAFSGSVLCRYFITLALAILWTPTQALLAQDTPLIAVQKANKNQLRKILTDTIYSGEIYGRITENKQEPAFNATVLLMKDFVVKGGQLTDWDGNFSMKVNDTGNYEIQITYEGCKTAFLTNVFVNAGARVQQNVNLERLPMKIFVMGLPTSDFPEKKKYVPHNAEVYGKIIDKQGYPMSNTKVTIFKEGLLKYGRRTNRNGDYSITKLDTGEYHFFVNDNDNITRFGDKIFVREGKNEQNIKLPVSR